MTKPAVATDIHEPFDTHLDLGPQLTFDQVFFLDQSTYPASLLFGPILRMRIPIETDFGEDLIRTRTPDAIDCGERYFTPLVVRNVYSSDSWHITFV